MAYIQIKKMMVAGIAITASLCASTQVFGAFFCDIDALYLKAYEGGLTNLCDQTNTVDVTVGDFTFSSITGHGVEPNFKWDWGYRLGLGYGFENCEGDGNQINGNFGVFWTHFNTKIHHCNNRWKLNYDTVDFLFSCKCPCQYSITLSPYAGIKLAKIDQRYHTGYVNPTNSVPIVELDFNKQNYEGFGPMLGLGAIWEDECGLGAYCNFDVAFLYGRAKLHSTGLDVFNIGANSFDFRQKHRTTQQIVVDGGIGVQYKQTFFDTAFLLHIGYEVHRYFDHNQFNDRGDLSLDGLSFGLAFEF